MVIVGGMLSKIFVGWNYEDKERYGWFVFVKNNVAVENRMEEMLYPNCVESLPPG
jgi:hypothetical protein